MRRLTLIPLLLLAAACGEHPRVSYKPPLDTQSPPEPVEPPKKAPDPPPPGSAFADSPVWLRQNSPVQWTCPSGWEEIQSTKPMRLVEFTIEKNGPGGAPIQFLILNGADESPKAREASFTQWQTMFHEDVPAQSTPTEHDGLKVMKIKVHGEFDGYPVKGSSTAVKEPNWTMLFGYVENVNTNTSVMFRLQGPDAIVLANEAKVDQLLAGMRPSTKKP